MALLGSIMKAWIVLMWGIYKHPATPRLSRPHQIWQFIHCFFEHFHCKICINTFRKHHLGKTICCSGDFITFNVFPHSDRYFWFRPITIITYNACALKHGLIHHKIRTLLRPSIFAVLGKINRKKNFPCSHTWAGNANRHMKIPHFTFLETLSGYWYFHC